MRRKSSPVGAHVGLLVAIVALLPGLLALLAAGVGGDPLASSLCLTQAAGACSVAALQGLDRRVVDAPALLATPALVDVDSAPTSDDVDVASGRPALNGPAPGLLPLRL